ncbi:glycosyltransferase family 87 protein [Tunturiibacter gelidoferens]|uniref:glycosyltransferase family 87 protein n=1 Tax=Tunturiibacter gelidiferens TaxID=3069689 RepID=UPI003873BDD6
MYPLTSQSALSAKHRWLILNVILLVATLNPAKSDRAFMGRLALIALLSFPLRTNFLFGQYYVLLLLLLTLACWLYVRRTRFFAGMMVGLASGLKPFQFSICSIFSGNETSRSLPVE